MINVYYEMNNGGYSEKIASFEHEETYIKCLPSLEKEAKKLNFDKVTEFTSA